jgi:hypothetical protein
MTTPQPLTPAQKTDGACRRTFRMWMFFHLIRTGRWESGWDLPPRKSLYPWRVIGYVLKYLFTEEILTEHFLLDRQLRDCFPETEAPGDVNPSRSEPEGLGIYSEDASRHSGRKKRRQKLQATPDDERQEKLFG